MSLTKCIKTRPPSQHVLCCSTSLRLDELTTKRSWSLGRTRRWTLFGQRRWVAPTPREHERASDRVSDAHAPRHAKAAASRENPAAWPTTTIARDQQRKVTAPKGEKSRIDTQSAKAHPTPEPIRRRGWRADEWSQGVPVASRHRTPTIRSAEGAAGERIGTRHQIM